MLKRDQREDFYVYVYLDPRKTEYNWTFEHNGVVQEFNLQPFYVGMGRKHRIFCHLNNNINEHKSNMQKYYLIQKLKRDGYNREYFKEFLIVKLVLNLNLDEANKIEENLIKRFGRRCDKSGILLNLTTGGNGVGGVGRSEESKQKFRERTKKRLEENGHPASRKVFEINEQQEIINIYDSIVDAGKDIKRSDGAIHQYFKTNKLRINGKILVLEEIFINKNHLEKYLTMKVNDKDVNKPVGQYTRDGIFIKSYSSIKEAGRQTNIQHGSISGCAQGRSKNSHAGGFLWKFI